MKTSFTKYLAQTIFALSAISLFGSCNNAANDVPAIQVSTQVDGIHLTRAVSAPTTFEKTSSLSDVVPDAVAQNLKKQGWVEHTFSDGRKLKYRNYMGSAMIEDDIIFAPTDMMPQAVSMIEKNLKKTSTTRGAGLNPNGCSLQIIWCWTWTSAYIWPSKTAYYKIDSNFSGAEKALLVASILRWNNSGVNIKFYPNTGAANQPTATFIRYVTNDFCGRTFIGYQARVVSNVLFPDNIDINPNCLVDRTIHHEMGHKVGMPHEQDRCDRDQFVTIVNNSGSGSPLCGSDFTNYTKFDFSSIMLYDSYYVQPKPNLVVGSYLGNPNNFPGYVLSVNDKTTINAIYP